MAYLIDTSIAIHARDGDAAVLNKLEMHKGAVVLSALSLARLQRGLYKKDSHAVIRRAGLEAILKRIPVLSFDTPAADAYGRIVVQRGWARNQDLDHMFMIAAHAISTASILVTSNEADFRDIPGLQIENWALGLRADH